MPDITPKLGLKKPVGTEAVTRAAYNENLDILDSNAADKNALAAVQQNVAAHLADRAQHIPYAAATGAANIYAVSLNPVPTTYTEGMALAVKINVDNTGASTVNVNGLGAKAIKKPNGNDVSAGNLKAGSIYTLRYNGANFILQGSDAAGNATAADLLAGKTASTDAGDIVGTMPNRGAVVITPGTANQAIANGYHNGSGYVAGDADLVAANIIKNKNIFGVPGATYPKNPGTFKIATHDTSKSISATSYTKAKTITVSAAGRYRVSFGVLNDNSWMTSHIRIYKNGVAYGTERVVAATYANMTFTEDLEFAVGDAIQIYAYVDTNQVFIKAFSLGLDLGTFTNS